MKRSSPSNTHSAKRQHLIVSDDKSLVNRFHVPDSSNPHPELRYTDPTYCGIERSYLGYVDRFRDLQKSWENLDISKLATIRNNTVSYPQLEDHFKSTVINDMILYKPKLCEIYDLCEEYIKAADNLLSAEEILNKDSWWPFSWFSEKAKIKSNISVSIVSIPTNTIYSFFRAALKFEDVSSEKIIANIDSNIKSFSEHAMNLAMCAKNSAYKNKFSLDSDEKYIRHIRNNNDIPIELKANYNTYINCYVALYNKLLPVFQFTYDILLADAAMFKLFCNLRQESKLIEDLNQKLKDTKKLLISNMNNS